MIDPKTLTHVELSESDVRQLNSPFNLKEAREATTLGLCHALAEAGVTPSEAEGLLKRAQNSNALQSLGELLGYTMVGGAAVGGYTGWARAKAEQAARGEDDPEIALQKRKLQSYRQMAQDLKRTTAVAQ